MAIADVAYDDDLRSLLQRHLDAHEVRRHPAKGRRRAAVSVVVVDSDADEHGDDKPGRQVSAAERRRILEAVPGVRATDNLTGTVEGTAGGASVLLTRRGSLLSDHPGQWALPGGRIENGETAVQAALREMEEEIGLALRIEAVLGRLDDFPTRSGYVISPFVFWGGADAAPVANPNEVASIHRVAIRELLREDSPRFVEIPESDRPVIQVPIGGDLIHAPTGAVLYQFRAVAFEGTLTRVDEYEQPVFAWR